MLDKVEQDKVNRLNQIEERLNDAWQRFLTSRGMDIVAHEEMKNLVDEKRRLLGLGHYRIPHIG